MVEIIAFLLDIVTRYVFWVYVACLVGIIYNLRSYHLARQARVNTIFTVEREVAAHREGRAMSNVGLLLGLMAVVLGLQFYLLPSIDVTDLVGVTPTPTLGLPTNTPRPTAVLVSITAVPETDPVASAPPSPPPPTATPASTQTPDVAPTAVPPTAVPPPATYCSDANVCISSPASNAVISGSVTIRGTAQHENFQFYKIEYGVGEEPGGWSSIGDTIGTPVAGGTLMSFDSRAFPNGVYWLRLTIVDITGNFPPPHRVRVVIAN